VSAAPSFRPPALREPGPVLRAKHLPLRALGGGVGRPGRIVGPRRDYARGRGRPIIEAAFGRRGVTKGELADDFGLLAEKSGAQLMSGATVMSVEEAIYLPRLEATCDAVLSLVEDRIASELDDRGVASTDACVRRRARALRLIERAKRLLVETD
jgi:hypothetical protein